MHNILGNRAKYFILAGEKSGDLHGGALAQALKKRKNEATIQGWGGREMQTAGVEILQDYSEISFMGLDFLGSLGKIRNLLKKCKAQLEAFKPDVLVLIDYSGFNLRIAKWAKGQGFNVVYYIAPKTWAWHSKRNRGIKKYVDKLLVILPFEEAYFLLKGIGTKYVGNPLVERIGAFRPVTDFRSNLPFGYPKIVALLPGSRVKEISRMAEGMKILAGGFDDVLFVVAGISEVNPSLYAVFQPIKNCLVVFDNTYDLLAIADAAVVTSGTATLETALFEVPQVVVYRSSALVYAIVKSLINVKYISLVNLILDKAAVPELIQKEYSYSLLEAKLRMLLSENSDTAIKQIADYKVLRDILGVQRASEEAANEIVNF